MTARKMRSMVRNANTSDIGLNTSLGGASDGAEDLSEMRKPQDLR